MTRALYIDCCIRGEQSRTKKLAEAFLASYGAREDVSLTRLTLTDEPLIPFTNGFFWQREQLLERGELDLAISTRDHSTFPRLVLRRSPTVWFCSAGYLPQPGLPHRARF